MGFGLAITFGEFLIPLPERLQGWLVEARVEMELSAPTRYALRFEDDICDGRHEVADDLTFEKNTDLGLFVQMDDTAYECLVIGPITKVRGSSLLGGPGSWVEFHGEDRRARMSRVNVEAKYKGKASAVVEQMFSAYQFEPHVQDTLIDYDEKTLPLTQNSTDLAFVDDQARRNNMEVWLEYEVLPRLPSLELKVHAQLQTSPKREQSLKAPISIPTLTPDAHLELRVAPPADICSNITRFDTRINYERPASVHGFFMSDDEQKKLVDSIVEPPDPLDAGQVRPVPAILRKLAAPTKPTGVETRLLQEAAVFEQSWFVEADCSASLAQLGFVIRPHQIVKVSHAGDALSGPYQVMKATHVITSTDHLIDFTIRANGLGGRS